MKPSIKKIRGWVRYNQELIAAGLSRLSPVQIKQFNKEFGKLKLTPLTKSERKALYAVVPWLDDYKLPKAGRSLCSASALPSTGLSSRRKPNDRFHPIRNAAPSASPHQLSGTGKVTVK